MYEFRVGKQSLRSGSLSPEGPVFKSSRQWAERDAARYPVGAKVEVRYDPSDPQRYFLAGYGGGLGIWISAAGAVALAGGAALIWFLV